MLAKAVRCSVEIHVFAFYPVLFRAFTALLPPACLLLRFCSVVFFCAVFVLFFCSAALIKVTGVIKKSTEIMAAIGE